VKINPDVILSFSEESSEALVLDPSASPQDDERHKVLKWLPVICYSHYNALKNSSFSTPLGPAGFGYSAISSNSF